MTSSSPTRVPVTHRGAAPAELRLFLREGLRDPAAVGAVAPSSPALVRALVAAAVASTRPVRVLEVGAGTGRATRALADGLAPGSRLDVVESNPRFAEHLRRLASGRSSDVDVRVVCGRVEDLRPAEPYDHIVSALPFTNFDPADVERILGLYTRWLRPTGTLSYFAYRGTATLRRATASPAEARRHRAVQRVLEAHHRTRRTSSTTVWRNLPPAVVRRVEEPAVMPSPVAWPGSTS
ncbi:class I SAM-dependent methyltransferase [Phycicoccus sp. DTK01]|uniref:class I SAM-dependent methyltransferase n=1 Tax=Phycicoccus sp. DTK01 TaxID=2785745 RepID=UPI001A90ABBE|nr:class I SAM-dependent methyltransferase [Phycicoccus sp. DTK01]GIL36282.1 hypothetical protein PDTK01_23570 [Phycicoccus sp. DTK01]